MKPSRDAAGGADLRQRGSGSTRHEQHRKRFKPDCRPSSPPLSGRPRRRFPACSQTGAIPASANPLAPRRGPSHASARLRCFAFWRLCGPAAGRRSADGDAEILIALCSFGSPASRAFLPRRLSDAGPSELLQGSAPAGIRNPSQEQTFRENWVVIPMHVRPLCAALAIRRGSMC